MRRFLTIAWSIVAAMAMLTACYKDDILPPDEDDAPEGYMTLTLPVSISDESAVQTRGGSVDPDGLDIHSISLFCFDKFGLYITYISEAETEFSGTNEGKILKVAVPENTRRIHFVANQNLGTFNDAAHRGKHEEQVMTELISSSGMMIYWARYKDDGAESATDFKNNLVAEHGATNGEDAPTNPIKLLRNQAKVTVKVKEDQPFTLEGFTVVNTQAFGTVAPRHPELGFDFTFDEGENPSWTASDFVTLPPSEYMAKKTPPADVDNAQETYVFETENTSDDPVSVIIKGKANDGAPTRYYRALVLQYDEPNNIYEYKMLRRNHHYTFNIVGDLAYGVETFEEALSSAPTNNIWLSIDDEVNEVRNDRYILGVEQTSVVVLAVPQDSKNPPSGYDYYYNGHKLSIGQIDLNYTFSEANGTAVNSESEKPEVMWLDDNQVARDWLDNDFVANDTKHQVTIQLNELNADNAFVQDPQAQKLEGTILIRKGLLQRKIKIIVLKQQSFVPMWVTTQMYGGDTDDNLANGFQGANVTMLFTVPETTPDELLPFEVYISVDHLDLRPEAGDPLPVIRSDDPRYGSDVRKHPNAAPESAEAQEMIGYKYVYTVTKKGDQRVYFKNILDQMNKKYSEHDHTEYITLESPYFATLRKPYVFSTDNHQRAITISNLRQYNAPGSGDPVYYLLVPPKKGAHATFDIRLMDGDSSTTGKYKGDPDDTSTPFDEFLLYSEYLDHDSETEHDDAACYAHFTAPIAAGTYGTNTRTLGMHFTKAPTNETVNDVIYDNVYPVKMHTNRAKSAEVVRLASNQVGSASAFPGKGNGDIYNGDTYRSVIFELANFRPFRFMASVAGEGLADGDANDGKDAVDHDSPQTEKDSVTNVHLTYQPNQTIEVAFDITDFIPDEAPQDYTVDPFGRAFKVFIDAPMLEIDETNANALLYANVTMPDGSTSQKFYKDSNGRFVYVVDGNRNDEATFWGNGEANKAKSARAIEGEGEGEGERKILPFKTNKIVSAGEIRIYADEEEVIYDEKVFHVTNTPISGAITYGADAGNQTPMPAGAFVSFALESDNSRIGSITVTSAGHYELRLRPEYKFNWSGESIIVAYRLNETTVYSKKITDLAELFNNTDIQLQAQ